MGRSTLGMKQETPSWQPSCAHCVPAVTPSTSRHLPYTSITSTGGLPLPPRVLRGQFLNFQPCNAAGFTSLPTMFSRWYGRQRPR